MGEDGSPRSGVLTRRPRPVWSHLAARRDQGVHTVGFTDTVLGRPIAVYPGGVHEDDVEQYLERLGLQRSTIRVDLGGLTVLQHAHLANVAFENLDIVFCGEVPHDRSAAFDKIVRGRRGGWCFELNGVFAQLLETLGFDVLLLGAAVLLDGPSTVIDHLALEVSGGPMGLEPHFVDVGFGDGSVRPLALNRNGPQDGGNAQYELFASPQGTTLARHVEGVPEAQLRFKRVAHAFDDFAPVASAMQRDPHKHWSTKPFATRLLDTDGTGRVTLTGSRLDVARSGASTITEVGTDEWDAALDDWFSMERPGPSPS